MKYDCYRLRKSSSPSQPQLAGQGLYSFSRRPPTSPQSRLRRPANPSPAVRTRRSSGTPLATRSRSLDGLLDEPTPSEPRPEQQLLRECEQYLSAQELNSVTEQGDMPVNKATNMDSDNVSTSSSGDARVGVSQGSLLSLPLPTSGEPKRKRNFMDKCVNKVRSLIKK